MLREQPPHGVLDLPSISQRAGESKVEWGSREKCGRRALDSTPVDRGIMQPGDLDGGLQELGLLPGRLYEIDSDLRTKDRQRDPRKAPTRTDVECPMFGSRRDHGCGGQTGDELFVDDAIDRLPRNQVDAQIPVTEER